jgi:hypothetical protein
MSGKRWWVAAGAIVLVAGMITVAVVMTEGGGRRAASASESSSSAVLPDDRYAILWAATRVGQSKTSVLSRWPKTPYQHYRDNLAEDCYEWEDVAAGPDNHQPAHLYNLCFKNGVLRLKTAF